MKNYFCIFLWEGLPEKEGVQFCLGGRGVGGAMTITETMTCNFHKHLQTSAS